MKFAQSIVLLASLVGPVALSVPVHAQVQHQASAEADRSEQVEAAGAVTYRAGVALEKVQALAARAPSPELDKAARLARLVRVQANYLAELIDSDASYDEQVDELLILEDYVLQLDASKRQLQQRYPRETALKNSLNDVRRTYFYLKQLLQVAI